MKGRILIGVVLLVVLLALGASCSSVRMRTCWYVGGHVRVCT